MIRSSVAFTHETSSPRQRGVERGVLIPIAQSPTFLSRHVCLYHSLDVAIVYSYTAQREASRRDSQKNAIMHRVEDKIDPVNDATPRRAQLLLTPLENPITVRESIARLYDNIRISPMCMKAYRMALLYNKDVYYIQCGNRTTCIRQRRRGLAPPINNARGERLRCMMCRGRQRIKNSVSRS